MCAREGENKISDVSHRDGTMVMVMKRFTEDRLRWRQAKYSCVQDWIASVNALDSTINDSALGGARPRQVKTT